MIIQRSFAGLALGILFGIGLSVSQMTNPEKVLAFLNVVRSWDPSLLFVMGAASTTALIGYRWAAQSKPLFDTQHFLPNAKDIDARLILGGVIFGLGWGLAGYCPGPAITGLASGSLEPVIFVGAMLVGSQLSRLVRPK